MRTACTLARGRPPPSSLPCTAHPPAPPGFLSSDLLPDEVAGSFSEPQLEGMLGRATRAAEALQQAQQAARLPLLPLPSPSRVEHLAMDALGRLRIHQLFDIVADFPDSGPAVQDLSRCLVRTVLRPQLVSSFRAALEARLLVPGAETATILAQYSAMFK